MVGLQIDEMIPGATSGEEIQLQSKFLTGIDQTDPELMPGCLGGVGIVGRVVSISSSSSESTMTTAVEVKTSV